MLNFLNNLDGNILLFIQDNIRNPVLNKIMIFITSLGNGGLIWIAVSVFLLFFKKTRKIGMMSLIGLLLSVIINNLIIKNIVARTRPYEVVNGLKLIIEKQKDFSFPSAHTAASFVSACIFYRNLDKKYGIPLIILAVLISLSRLYVGVHYPSDVFCGMISGILLSYLAQYVVEKIKKREG